MIALQLILQFVRTMRIDECQYQANGRLELVINIITIISFLFAMWGLFVVYRSGKLCLTGISLNKST